MEGASRVGMRSAGTHGHTPNRRGMRYWCQLSLSPLVCWQMRCNTTFFFFPPPSPLTSYEPARIWIRRCGVAARWKRIPNVNADKERGETQSRGMCDFKGVLKGENEFFFNIYIYTFVYQTNTLRQPLTRSTC